MCDGVIVTVSVFILITIGHQFNAGDEQSILLETSRPQWLFSEPTHLTYGCTRKFTSNSYFLLSTPCKTNYHSLLCFFALPIRSRDNSGLMKRRREKIKSLKRRRPWLVSR